MFDLAIGAVSLGFQVTQAVVLYYRGIQNRKEEIQESLDEINRLNFAFASLNAALPNVLSVSEEDGVLLQKSLISINDRLVSLREWLDDVGVPRDAEKLRGRIKETCRALSYPFRRDEMRAIRRKVGDILRDLQVVLDIHSLKQGISHEKNLQSVEIALASLSSKQLAAQRSNESNLHELGEIIQDEVLGLKRELTTIGAGIDDISRGVSTLQTNIIAANQAVQQTGIQNADKLDTIIDMFGEFMLRNSNKIDANQPLTKTATHRTVFQMARQVPPSLQQEAFEELELSSPNSTTQKYEAEAIFIGEQTTPCPICHCAPNQKTTDSASAYSSFGIHIATQRATRHKPNCVAFARETSVAVSSAWKFGSTVLSMLLNVGYNSDAGAGGISLSPQIRCINLVSSERCPVRLRMLEFRDRLEARPSADVTLSRLKALKKELLQIYRDGQASPYDVNERGETTLTSFMQICSDLSFREYNDKQTTEAKTEIYTTLAAVGCSTEQCGTRFFILMTRDDSSAQAACLRSALGCNEDSIEPSSSSVHILERNVQLFRKAPDLLRYFNDLEPIFRAVVLQSEQSLNECIAAAPGSRFYKYHNKSILFFAASWPNGLSILLRGLQDNEIQSLFGDAWNSHMILNQAVRLGSAESLGILLDAGEHMIGLEVLAAVMCDYSNGIHHLPFSHFADIIAPRLAQKARAVCQFSKLRLPRTAYLDLVGYHQSADYVPGAEAWKLCAAARDAGIDVPQSIDLPDHFPGYFQLIDINPYMFQSLASHGFGDYLQSRSREGLLPVMNLLTSQKTWHWVYLDSHPMAMSEVFPWLEHRSLLDGLANDTESIGINTSSSGWHYLAAGMGHSLHIRWNKWHLSCVDEMFDRLARQQSRDDCKCFCSESSQGCTPLMLFCRSRTHAYHGLLAAMGRSNSDPSWHTAVNRQVVAHHFFGHSKTWPSVSGGGGGDAGMMNSRFPPWSRDLIRLLTFEALEMTHTCCTLRKMPRYPGNTLYHPEQCGIFCTEPEEFDAEERDAAAAKLDGLMQFFDEYLASVAAMEETLDSFIWGFWRRRMAQEYVVEPETLRELQRDVLDVEIGVTPKPLRAILGENFSFLIRDDSEGLGPPDTVDTKFAPQCGVCIYAVPSVGSSTSTRSSQS